MPTWTKKDYEMVAEVLRQSPLDDRLDTKDGDRDILVQAFASRFEADNDRFDQIRFDAAVFRGELTKRSTARHGGWTRQDYEMIADVLRESIASDAAKAVVAQFFADRLYYDNSRFDSDKFFKRALGADYKTRVFHYGPTYAEQADAIWRAQHGFPPVPLRRRPGDIPVVSHVRRRPRKSIVDRFGHRIRVKEWPGEAGLATLRRHYKRQHPIAWRLSVMKGVRTRKRRQFEQAEREEEKRPENR